MEELRHGPKNKEIDDNVQSLTPREKKEEEDLPTFKDYIDATI